jgi:hypothetical protein
MKDLASTIAELVEILEKRYPNDIFVLQSQDKKDEYVAKLEMIQEIKKIGGIVDGFVAK